MPDFKDTYIGITIGHSSDLDRFYNIHFNMARPFYPPYTKWAAAFI